MPSDPQRGSKTFPYIPEKAAGRKKASGPQSFPLNTAYFFTGADAAPAEPIDPT
jgi:hypothetical protein